MTENGTVENTETAPVAPVVTPVVVKMKIYMDAAGNEIGREPVGRGRPPFGSEKDKDGNTIVHNATKDGDKFVYPKRIIEKVEKTITYYITLNADGTVKEQKARGRGRPNKLFTLATEGQFSGNYVMTEKAPEIKVETTEPVVEETKPDGSAIETNTSKELS